MGLEASILTGGHGTNGDESHIPQDVEDGWENFQPSLEEAGVRRSQAALEPEVVGRAWFPNNRGKWATGNEKIHLWIVYIKRHWVIKIPHKVVA